MKDARVDKFTDLLDIFPRGFITAIAFSALFLGSKMYPNHHAISFTVINMIERLIFRPINLK